MRPEFGRSFLSIPNWVSWWDFHAKAWPLIFKCILNHIWQAPRKERTHVWHLLVYLVCISRASDSNLGWEWWDSSETHETTGDSRRRSERPVARGRCPKQTMSIHEPMIFVVMLWSSLAVFDLLISLDVFSTKARKRVAKHSEQFSIFGNFIQNFCQVALRWLLFCEVPHQKPRKTTSRLPSCPLALISFFQVQEFLCFGPSVWLDSGIVYNFTAFLRNYMAALREARYDHHLDDCSLYSCMRCVDIRHSTGARGGEWWRKREDRKDSLIGFRNLATFWDIFRHVVSRPWIDFTSFHHI